MLRETSLTDILFLDIETIPAYPNYASAPEPVQELWQRKSSRLFGNERSPDESYERAGIYAEFGKVLCISMARVHRNREDGNVRISVRSIAGEDESRLLSQFSRVLQKENARPLRLCAHNGKEFDFPFLSRRMLINGITLPRLLDNAGKKPWEIPHFDTLEMWKFGDYKHYTSLEVLAHVFGIPSPKHLLDGSKVASTWYQENNLSLIRDYCEADVLTLVNVFLRLCQQQPEQELQVEYSR